MNQDVKNLITDVPGILVGNAEDRRLKSGVTVVLCAAPSVASCHVMGGAPGTRDTDLLSPDNTVEQIDAIVLSGGSAFGLDAASGVMAGLAGAGRGFAVGSARVPIVPGAILFDLLNGGDKACGPEPAYRALGAAALAAAARDFSLGSHGAGTGATTATCKGGLGSASQRLANGMTVAALAAANALGSATIGATRHFWAAAFERDGEFGGLGWPSPLPADAADLALKGHRPGENTTLAVVATDAALSKAQAKRLAVMAHDGFARALWPAHTPLDGDIVFAIATGHVPLADPVADMVALGAAAAAVTARAIARGVYEATPEPGDVKPAWRDL
jgi:L-aminopeptidase/D-esterase-like protein